MKPEIQCVSKKTLPFEIQISYNVLSVQFYNIDCFVLMIRKNKRSRTH